jgi:hypothetical protein
MRAGKETKQGCAGNKGQGLGVRRDGVISPCTGFGTGVVGLGYPRISQTQTKKEKRREEGRRKERGREERGREERGREERDQQNDGTVGANGPPHTYKGCEVGSRRTKQQPTPTPKPTSPHLGDKGRGPAATIAHCLRRK